ncbi:MAG: hypothetical protein ABRQ26_03655 [Syntrophomonadaceae bacterium]
MNDITSKLINLGIPMSKDVYPRNVWDMQLFNGKIYIGYGNSSNGQPSPNAGPISVIYYDPVAAKFITQLTADEEEIAVLKIIAGNLYIPGIDTREGWSFGNLWVLRPNGGYEKLRTIPNAEHVLDVALYNDKLFCGNGATSARWNVTVSPDGGHTWQAKANNFNACEMGSAVFVYKGKLYCSSIFFYYDIDPANNFLVADGDTITVIHVNGKKMFPGMMGGGISYKMLRTQVLNGKLIYLGVKIANAMQWNPEGLFILNGDIGSQANRIALPVTGVLPTDIVVRSNTVYVSAFDINTYTNYMFKSTDLVNWNEIFRFTSNTFARSFEELNGDFYLGMGCYINNLVATTGTIYKAAAKVIKESEQR